MHKENVVSMHKINYLQLSGKMELSFAIKGIDHIKQIKVYNTTFSLICDSYNLYRYIKACMYVLHEVRNQTA